MERDNLHQIVVAGQGDCYQQRLADLRQQLCGLATQLNYTGRPTEQLGTDEILRQLKKQIDDATAQQQVHLFHLSEQLEELKKGVIKEIRDSTNSMKERIERALGRDELKWMPRLMLVLQTKTMLKVSHRLIFCCEGPNILNERETGLHPCGKGITFEGWNETVRAALPIIALVLGMGASFLSIQGGALVTHVFNEVFGGDWKRDPSNVAKFLNDQQVNLIRRAAAFMVDQAKHKPLTMLEKGGLGAVAPQDDEDLENAFLETYDQVRQALEDAKPRPYLFQRSHLVCDDCDLYLVRDTTATDGRRRAYRWVCGPCYYDLNTGYWECVSATQPRRNGLKHSATPLSFDSVQQPPVRFPKPSVGRGRDEQPQPESPHQSNTPVASVCVSLFLPCIALAQASQVLRDQGYRCASGYWTVCSLLTLVTASGWGFCIGGLVMLGYSATEGYSSLVSLWGGSCLGLSWIVMWAVTCVYRRRAGMRCCTYPLYRAVAELLQRLKPGYRGFGLGPPRKV